ncbi:hypothetical protein [Dactylosporangium sp. NPDC000521]|uniref:hypothetical protein n=1 Tax=Dactylosporangium sp. NPDC000521 TaxID=3363975 RepID=UPI0036793050
MLRIILCAVGAGQVALGVMQIASAHTGGAAHLVHELAAWNVAVGCGFLWIAVPGRRRDADGRRARSVGALPMLTAFMAVLAAGETYDLVTGTVGVAGLLSHGAAFAGYLIVVGLARLHRTAPLPVPQPV